MWFGGDSMSDESIPHLRFLIAGKLHRDFIVLPDGRAVNDVLGGSLIYSAVGATIWEQSIGLLGAYSGRYSPGLDNKNITERDGCPGFIQPRSRRFRHFTGFIDMDTVRTNHLHNTAANLPFPKRTPRIHLHNDACHRQAGRNPPHSHCVYPTSPPIPFDCTATHLAPWISFPTPPSSAFRQGSINTIWILHPVT